MSSILPPEAQSELSVKHYRNIRTLNYTGMKTQTLSRLRLLENKYMNQNNTLQLIK